MIKPKNCLKNLFRTTPKKRSGCLRMDMNESVDGLPAAFIRNALRKADPELIAKYPEYGALTKKIAVHNGIKTENISLANGSDAAIKYIFDAYISTGDSVLVTDPTFAMYPVYCKMFNAKTVSIEYSSDLEFPYDAFMERLDKRIKMAVVVNPNNPTGSVISRGSLLSIIKKAKKNGTLLLVDEAYFYYYPYTVIKEIKRYENLIILRTFSKLCGMAGIRLGYVAANTQIIETLRKVKPTFDVNGLAVLLAEYLLGKPEMISEAIKTFNRGKKYLVKKLSEANIEYRQGQANFVLINCGNRTEEIINSLSKKKVLLHGRFSQDFLRDYIRVSVGSEKVMAKFWSIFCSIWRT